ncbi:MAG TPA: hypothetical protein VGS07_34240 [Thermoanaerobaculia bacterium]|jgi:hypothetical protein|nr:hypothetical protein [Thermoanaerobaculia bacterium]
MSKHESYALLTEPELLTVGPRATSTGTIHTLTAVVDVTVTPKTVKVSDPSLHIHNGDKVIWDFKDPAGAGLRLPDPKKKLAVVFIDMLESTPGDANSDPKISLDLSENTPGSDPAVELTARYQIKIGTEVVVRTLRTPGDTQLVIDGLGKPPGTAPKAPGPHWRHRYPKG